VIARIIQVMGVINEETLKGASAEMEAVKMTVGRNG
jgi:hypothetical protein